MTRPGHGTHRSSSKLRILFFNLLLLVAGLFLVELVFGNWLRPQSRIARLNLLYNRSFVFDATPLYGRTGAKVLYKRDRFGFRGSYPDPGHIDILTIGGSTTDQRYITEGKTWQDVLAAEFRKSGKPVSVVNAGVDGQSTYGHLKNFDWWFSAVPGLRVRYFLFYVGVNDFVVSAGDPDDALEDRPAGIPALLSENSAIYYLLRTAKGVYLAWRRQIGHHKVDFSKLDLSTIPLQADYEALMRGRLVSYKRRLAELLERCRRFGGRPIVVTQGCNQYRIVGDRVFGYSMQSEYAGRKINGVDAYHMIGKLNKASLEVCRGAGAVCVDAGSEIEWGDEDFYDFAHNTPRGAEKLGLYLHRGLAHLF